MTTQRQFNAAIDLTLRRQSQNESEMIRYDQTKNEPGRCPGSRRGYSI
jgi:hypothetical protein